MDRWSILIDAVIVLVFSFAGAVEGRRLLRRHPALTVETVHKAAPYLYLMLAFTAVVFVAAISVDQAMMWHWPLWLQYHFLTLVWGSLLAVFSFVFTLAVYLSFRTLHAERWKLAGAALLAVVVVPIAQHNFSSPIYAGLSRLVDPEGVVLQTSGTSCAAASAANILGVFGIERTEREMARMFQTSKGGTSTAHIVRGMAELGLHCERRHVPVDDIAELAAPAMLFIDHPRAGKEGHAVAYMGIREGQAEIWDPMEGRRWFAVGDLHRFWHGRALSVRRRE